MFHGLTLLLYSTAWAACLGHAFKLKSQVNFVPSDLSPLEAAAFLRLNDDPSASLNGTFSLFKTPDKSGNTTDYLCFVPELSLNQSNPTPRVASDHISNEPELVSKALDIINSSFSRDSCVFLYGVGGSYWTYAFCYMDKIIQFHVDMPHLIQNGEHKAVIPNHVYVLGRFRGAPRDSYTISNDAKTLLNVLSPRDFNIYDETSDESTSSLGSTKSQRFLQHTISDGEICNLIAKPRTIDIIYSCDPNNMQAPTILDVQEILTCRYQITITVPQLCQLQEFVPRISQDEVKTINCRKISSRQGERHNPIDVCSETDFMTLKSPPELNFPLGQDLHINLKEFSVFPLGFGLYRIYETITQNNTNDWDIRLRLVLNKPCNSTREVAAQVKQILTWTLHRLIPSPRFTSQNTVEALSWDDSFVMWFEVYDYFGAFQTLVRVERNGGDHVGEIGVIAVDPLTMEDPEGNSIAPGDFDATGGMWNFEYFESNEDRLSAMLSAEALGFTQDKLLTSNVAASDLLESIASKLGYESTDKVLDSLEEILSRFQEPDLEEIEREVNVDELEDDARKSSESSDLAQNGNRASAERELGDPHSSHISQEKVTSLPESDLVADHRSDHDSSLNFPALPTSGESNAAVSKTKGPIVQSLSTSTSTSTSASTSRLPHDEL